MAKRKCFALSLAVMLGLPGYSFEFRPCITLFGSHTQTKNETFVQSGAFHIDNRENNFGFEFANKFSLAQYYFIKTGIRCTGFNTTISAKNQIPGLSDESVPVYWQTGYTAITVPILVGKDFATRNDNNGDIYIGVSAGTVMNAYRETGSKLVPGNSSFNFSVTDTRIPQRGTYSTSYPYATADFGASYQLFNWAPRFYVGVLFCTQINKAPRIVYSAEVENETTGTVYDYNIRHRQQFTNYSITISYMLGSQRSLTSAMLSQGP